MKGPDVQRQILVHRFWKTLVPVTTSNNALDSERLITCYVPVEAKGLIREDPEKNSKGRD